MIPGSNSQARPETIEELEQRKVDLFKEISDLGKTKEDLDTVIQNHDAQNKKFSDLTQAIEDKETVIALLKPEIQNLSESKLQLESECKSLNANIEEKGVLMNEIDRLKQIVRVLQEEETEFRSSFELLKDKSTQEIRNAKDKLKFLSATISSVLSQM